MITDTLYDSINLPLCPLIGNKKLYSIRRFQYLILLIAISTLRIRRELFPLLFLSNNRFRIKER